MENPDELIPPEPAGKHLGDRSPATLQWWRTVGRGPVYVKIGRKVFYRRRDLDAFIASGEVQPERETAA